MSMFAFVNNMTASITLATVRSTAETSDVNSIKLP